MHDETRESGGPESGTSPANSQVPPQLWAVNLVSDPIHGYIELTKRLTLGSGLRRRRRPKAICSIRHGCSGCGA